MFTGIITDIGEVIVRDESGGDVRFRIKTSYDLDGIDIGSSICCSGCCLTVVEKGGVWFAVDVSAESFDKTVLGQWEVGTAVNLERSLQMGDELGGHIVSGHVDGVAELVSIIPDGDSHQLKVKIPAAFQSFIAQKGSVALDGISLTVNDVSEDMFTINIIPHTWNVTTFGAKQPGDKINFEIDMLARYVARMLEVKDAAA